METPPSLIYHNVVGHKHGKSGTPSTTSFYIMNGMFLFLILHIFKGIKIQILQKKRGGY